MTASVRDPKLLGDAELLAHKDSLIGQRKRARRHGDTADVRKLDGLLVPVWGELLRRNQPEPSDAFYVECSVPAGVQLGDYRNRGAA